MNYSNAIVTFGGESFRAEAVSIEMKDGSILDVDDLLGWDCAYSGTASVDISTADFVQLIGMFNGIIREGRRLARRAIYNNRGGRRAKRRLFGLMRSSLTAENLITDALRERSRRRSRVCE